MPSARRTLFAASLGFFVVILDTTIVNLALPAIGDDLGGDLGDLQWVVDGYVVAFAALLLSSGALGDRIGVARGYSAGMLVFTVASVACGLAPSLPVLLGARVLQGVGAALLLPNSLALVRLAYHDPGARAKAIATWAAMGGVALAAGPVVGGILTTTVDWRAIFFLNVPVGILAIALTSRAPRSPRERTPLDLPGQAAAIVAIGALTFAVIEAGQHGIGAPATLIAAALFVVGATAFVAIERRSSHPAVPFDLFRSHLVATAVAGGMLFNFAFYGQVFVLSLYFQDVLGHSALISGLMFLPLTALIAATNVVAGRLTSREGPRRPLIVGELILIAGLLAMLVFDETTADRGDPGAGDPDGDRGRHGDPAADRGAAGGPAARAGRARLGRLQRRPAVRRRARGRGVRRTGGDTGSSPGCTSRWSWARSRSRRRSSSPWPTSRRTRWANPSPSAPELLKLFLNHLAKALGDRLAGRLDHLAYQRVDDHAHDRPGGLGGVLLEPAEDGLDPSGIGLLGKHGALELLGLGECLLALLRRCLRLDLRSRVSEERLQFVRFLGGQSDSLSDGVVVADHHLAAHVPHADVVLRRRLLFLAHKTPSSRLRSRSRSR